MTESESQQVEI